MIEQLDLFGTMPAATAMPTAPPPKPQPAPAGVHWLHVTTTRARTACGIVVPAFYHKFGVGYSAAGKKIACTTNRDDGTTTCPRCKETF